MGSSRYRNGFDLTIHEDLFETPLRWKQTRVIFVNSMSDLFHESIPVAAVKKIFATMNKASWHTFQILTKRPMHAMTLLDDLTWTPNIWMGVSVESYRYIHRIEALRQNSCKSALHFVRAAAHGDPPGHIPAAHSLGDHWRRIRTRRPADEEGMGNGSAEALPEVPYRILLQAMGRRQQEGSGSYPRRQNLGRDADDS